MELPDETALRMLAERKIEIGALPRMAPESAYAGRGSELPCSLCGQPISVNEYEFEYPNDVGEGPRFHLRCRETWLLVLAGSCAASRLKRR